MKNFESIFVYLDSRMKNFHILLFLFIYYEEKIFAAQRVNLARNFVPERIVLLKELPPSERIHVSKDNYNLSVTYISTIR